MLLYNNNLKVRHKIEKKIIFLVFCPIDSEIKPFCKKKIFFTRKTKFMKERVKSKIIVLCILAYQKLKTVSCSPGIILVVAYQDVHHGDHNIYFFPRINVLALHIYLYFHSTSFRDILDIWLVRIDLKKVP